MTDRKARATTATIATVIAKIKTNASAGKKVVGV
jgi:hypothetical protein